MNAQVDTTNNILGQKSIKISSYDKSGSVEPYYADKDSPLFEKLQEIIDGDLAAYTCLVGTMAQEVYASHPAIRDACAASIFAHAATIEPDIAEAMAVHGVTGEWTAASLAVHTQAVLQGAFILAKATGDADVARDSVDHLARYVRLLFGRQGGTGQ